MCGLFGSMSGYLSKDEINKTLLLGFLSSTRGMDATGFCMGFKNANEKTKEKTPFVYDGHKDTTDAVEFFNEDRAQEIINSKLDKVLMLGHTRFATIGDKSVKNAHPHLFKHIIGAHNGTVRAFNVKDDDKKIGSDSRVLFKRIAEQGLVPTLKDASFGAYALTFIDKNAKTLNFVRNSDRPLWFMKLKSGGTIWWASERRMLAFMANESAMFDEPFQLPVDTLFTFEIGKPGVHEEKKLVLREPIVYHGHWNNGVHRHDKLSKRERKALRRQWPHGTNTQTGTHGQCNGRHYEWDENDPVGDAALPLALPSPRVSVSNENSRIAEHIREVNNQLDIEFARANGPNVAKYKNYMYKGYGGHFSTIAEAEHKLQDGCAGCPNVCDLEDPVYWIDDNQYVCEDCSKQEWVSQFFSVQDEGSLVALKEI